MTYSRPAPPGHAFATIALKTGSGRNTRQKPGALHVEDQECPEWAGTHELVNDQLRTYCAHCGRNWRGLDAQLRSAS